MLQMLFVRQMGWNVILYFFRFFSFTFADVFTGSRTGGSCFSMREPFFFPQEFCSHLQKNYSTHCSFTGMHIFIINQNYC